MRHVGFPNEIYAIMKGTKYGIDVSRDRYIAPYQHERFGVFNRKFWHDTLTMLQILIMCSLQCHLLTAEEVSLHPMLQEDYLRRGKRAVPHKQDFFVAKFAEIGGPFPIAEVLGPIL